ncbi:unnamed protein product [Cyprideis torosa]|uniref:Uncharacterized protein n=1 Tax=Cyprideis torosa TaxID=163714 RepID=A0A7R8WIS6_9CRUS|nr:unnamed protein product [Cyprideis torosa]CAG0895156.1 unnamed protein product [Cyprideis torosa]
MASEIQKEHSALESQFPDELFHFTKLDESEHSTDPNDFSGSGGTLPLPDVTAVSMANNNQTDGAPDQIDTSEDEGTRRKGKNSRGHRQKKKRFTCAVCGKSLSSKEMLQYHEFTHTGEKRFACKICGKAFALRGTLQWQCIQPRIDTHRRETLCLHNLWKIIRAENLFILSQAYTHWKETLCLQDLWKIICTEQQFIQAQAYTHWVCGKSFAHNQTLSAHKRTHTGEKRFHCSVCGRGFRSKVGFQGHTKKHSQEEPSVCALCNQPFRLEEDLEKHMKWHIQSDS